MGILIKEKLIDQLIDQDKVVIAEEEYEEWLKRWYYNRTGKNLNLLNPKTFNEKIQWLKLYDNSELKTQLTDKYEVREWVKNKIGEDYLIPLIGVWNDVTDIDWNALPEKFVLKATHGSGWNILIKDKQRADKIFIYTELNKWMQKNWCYMAGLELQYKNIKPRIIAEEYLDNVNGDLHDYKVFCFNGKAKYIMYVQQRFSETKSCFFDLNWKKQKFTFNFPIYEKEVKKPERFKEMIWAAEILAQGFAHVRVDFYVLNDNSIKFGEMTFTTTSGTARWIPEQYNKYMGDLLVLSEK